MLEVAQKRNIIFGLFVWHFVGASKAILLGWRNFLFSNASYFSFGQMLRHFFGHWHGMKSDYGRGFDPKLYFNVFLGNLISRILAAFMRLVLLAIGLAIEIFIFIVGLAVLLVWIFLPIIALAFLFYGIGLLV